MSNRVEFGTVHIYPRFGGEDKGDGGVRRVVEAQLRHLPASGFQPVESPEGADVIACHITVPSTYLRLYPEKPFVAHCHGLYWAEYEWATWALKANADVMELLRVADAVTAPSEWVARALRRHTSRPVHVVPHGVELEEWSGGTPRGYVLWNKTRPDPVCDPKPVTALAKAMPDVLFVATFAEESQNLCECPDPDNDHEAGCHLQDSRIFDRIARLVNVAAVRLDAFAEFARVHVYAAGEKKSVEPRENRAQGFVRELQRNQHRRAAGEFNRAREGAAHAVAGIRFAVFDRARRNADEWFQFNPRNMGRG